MYKIIEYKTQIIFSAVAVILIVALFVIYSPQNTQPSAYTNSLDSLITQIQKTSEKNPESVLHRSDKYYSFWISSDGYGIGLSTYAILISRKPSESVKSVLSQDTLQILDLS